jgi:predicted RNA-binding Zn-ribbon protein involved in translation (DUF1610 family)
MKSCNHEYLKFESEGRKFICPDCGQVFPEIPGGYKCSDVPGYYKMEKRGRAWLCNTCGHVTPRSEFNKARTMTPCANYNCKGTYHAIEVRMNEAGRREVVG